MHFRYHASKINVTPEGVYLPISKLQSILAVANLLSHNNISQICYCGQISLQSAAVNCSFSDKLTPLGVTFILLAMVAYLLSMRFCHLNLPSTCYGKMGFLISLSKIRWEDITVSEISITYTF